jgi:UDP-N-acetylmuramoyl-L-alanyl-D-glutamate--2,6-diaminopimelate ligase
MITVRELAAAIPGDLLPEVTGDLGTIIESLAYDSRLVFAGVGFVCLKGAKSDGHEFRAEASNRGARFFIVGHDRAADFVREKLSIVAVSDTRKALPYLAAAFYGYPTRSFELIGITGTNGKTTTAFMVSAIWSAAGEKSGVIGTVGATVDGVHFPTNWTVSTTPESLDLQQFFSQMRGEHVKHAVIEVTSIAIDQERTTACDFNTAILTNLTQDHLDYHGSMEAYEAAKARLFLEYPSSRTEGFISVFNLDDPAGVRLRDRSLSLGIRAVGYGLVNKSVDFQGLNVVAKADGTVFNVRELNGPEYSISLPIGGLFNVSNALAAIASTRSRGVSVEAVQRGLAHLAPVPGRFEPVSTNGKDFHVLVDYAHTPDGLENVLKSARALSPNRVVVVFGCGGNRDRTKRPKMGKIASDLADQVVVTSDNPRNEAPDFIISEIMEGITGQTDERVRTIVDRREAIRVAVCEIARPGDIVVIAGKGHETYQLVKGQSFPFDDRLVAAEALAKCS